MNTQTIAAARPEEAPMREIVVDSFAGGGGASVGIEWALGQSPDVAINHDADAIRMHEVNHPETLHLNSNIYHVDPREVRPGEPIGLLWASPDCTHHSKAKGGVPIRPEGRNSRDLGWVIVSWAERRRPRVIILENVEEWLHWGPLVQDEEGRLRPCPERKGLHFQTWVKKLKRLGYKVEWKELRACDYGAPTIRKRLFVIARCDGAPIVWPEPTHGAPDSAEVLAGLKKPYRTAAEIIDWTLPCPSIFMTREEARAYTAETGTRVNRPLKPNTMARVAKGVKRYVLDAAEPYLVTLNHGGDWQRPWGLDEPFRTVTAARDAHALISPVMAYAQQGGGVRDPRDPHTTITASSKDQNQVIAPVLTKFRRDSAGAPVDAPAPTMTANSFHKRPGGAPPVGVAVPYLVPRYGERAGQEPRTRGVDEPAPTVVPTGNGANPAVAFLAQHNTGLVGHDPREPVSTIVSKGCTQGLVGVSLQKYYGTDQDPDPHEPLHTLTTRDRYGVVAAHMLNMKGTQRSSRSAEDPVSTQTTGSSHAGIIAALAETPPFAPEHEARAREVADLLRAHGLWDERAFVTLTIAGVELVIVDIGMRMLTPREQFRAQSFPDTYRIDADSRGRAFTKSTQTRCCGNSVPPVMAKVLVSANVELRDVQPPAREQEGPLFTVAAE